MSRVRVIPAKTSAEEPAMSGRAFGGRLRGRTQGCSLGYTKAVFPERVSVAAEQRGNFRDQNPPAGSPDSCALVSIRDSCPGRSRGLRHIGPWRVPGCFAAMPGVGHEKAEEAQNSGRSLGPVRLWSLERITAFAPSVFIRVHPWFSSTRLGRFGINAWSPHGTDRGGSDLIPAETFVRPFPWSPCFLFPLFRRERRARWRGSGARARGAPRAGSCWDRR